MATYKEFKEYAKKFKDMNEEFSRNNWIRCSEQMPDTNRDVLVASRSTQVGTARLYRHKSETYWSPPSTVSGVDSELDFIGEITHWRELPEPPKEEL